MRIICARKSTLPKIRSAPIFVTCASFPSTLPPQRVTDLRRVKTAAISDYVAWMAARKVRRDGHRARALASIKSFMPFLPSAARSRPIPLAGVAALKVERRFPEILTGKEVELFLDQPRCVDAKGLPRSRDARAALCHRHPRERAHLARRERLQPFRRLHPLREQGARSALFRSIPPRSRHFRITSRTSALSCWPIPRRRRCSST